MELFTLSLVSTMITLILVSQAASAAIDSSSAPVLLPRSQFCYGSKTKAGTRFQPRELGLREPLPPDTHLTTRSPPRVAFCAPGTSTYVVVDFHYQIPDDYPTVQVTVDAHNEVLGWVSEHGDSVLAQGYVTYEDATFALWGYVNWLTSTWGAVGAITFEVFDGLAQVGTGQLQLL
ncbi:MAG: hypothetical protein FRX48_09587 [Lasallia pustulata]|uniref:Uncharacterized protein n=1 Tax=Lasallia pustulata TaxID=136370 RepID=A0A5M8PBP5_9LECA|nr:MAG: hypothetical protein FRX48_09587 [Lasallia pustulata]